MRLINKIKKKILLWILDIDEEIVLRNVRILNLKVGRHTIRITKSTVEVDGKIIIQSSSGAVYIRNLDGLQLPVGTGKYVP